MAITLKTNISLGINYTYADSVADQAVSGQPKFQQNVERASGTGLKQMDFLWWDKRVLAATTSEELDLAGGSLKDAFGNTVDFQKIKQIYVYNRNTTLNDDLELFGGTNGILVLKDVSDIYNLGPEGTFYVERPDADGWTVTAGTADKIKVNNVSGNAVTYDIAIAGVKA